MTEEKTEGANAITESINVGGIAADQIRSIVERIERLEEEKSVLGVDIKEVYSEAKGNGFDTKIIRQVIALRKTVPADRQEQEALRDLYFAAANGGT